MIKKIIIYLLIFNSLAYSSDKLIILIKNTGDGAAFLASKSKDDYVCFDENCYYFASGEFYTMNEDAVPAEAVYPDFTREIYAPNDFHYANGDQWALTNADLGWTAAYQKVEGQGSDVEVAVVDSGFVLHVDSGMTNVNCTNATSGVMLPVCNDYNPIYSHGSHVTGIISALTNNGAGVAGVSGGYAKTHVYNASYDGQYFFGHDLLRAYQDVYNKVNSGVNNFTVLNLSIGGGSYSQPEYDILNLLGSKGVVVVAAAGNESSNNGILRSYPAEYNLNNIISVAALTTVGGNIVFDDSYSNYGGRTDMSAPGTDIMSFGNNNDYIEDRGTSMAAPYISGVLAAGKSVGQNLSGGQLMRILFDTSRVNPTLNGRVIGSRQVDVDAFITAVKLCSSQGNFCTYDRSFPARQKAAGTLPDPNNTGDSSRLSGSSTDSGLGCSMFGGTESSGWDILLYSGFIVLAWILIKRRRIV